MGIEFSKDSIFKYVGGFAAAGLAPEAWNRASETWHGALPFFPELGTVAALYLGYRFGTAAVKHLTGGGE